MVLNLQELWQVYSNNDASTQDPGEDFSTAFNLGVLSGNLTITESVGSNDLADVYQFTLNQAGEFSLSLEGLSGDADIGIFDSNGTLIGVSENASTEGESLSGTLDAGVYYVNVSSYDGIETNYNLNLFAGGTASPQNPSPDPGNTLSTALQIGNLGSGFVSQETVGLNDSVDFYEFSVSQSGIFTADLSQLSADADVRLINDANNNGAIDPGEVTAWQWERGSDSESIRSFLESGNYVLEVSTYDNQTTNYTVETNFTGAASDPQDFNIEVVFGQGSEGLSQEMTNGVLEAAEFWENVISHSSFDGSHTLTIEVGGLVQEWGANGGVLASAGPHDGAVDTNNNLQPTYGVSFINTNPEAVEALSSNLEFFTGVMIHEFGHVMGIGTLWEQNGLIDPTTATYNANTYAGMAYGELLGTFSPTAIPLTTGEGQGSDLGHWQEEIFGNELMTHLAENPGVSMPLSQMTIASLQDLGWNVNYGAAEFYPDSFTDSATASLGADTSNTDTASASACVCGLCSGYSSDLLSQNLMDAVGVTDLAAVV